MDGLELARRMAERLGSGRPYLVALTDYGQPADRQAAFAAGFDAHVTKPLNPRDLRKVFEDARRAKESA
jgi:CheY-like chemotaxis protein